MLRETAIDPARLTFEITETAAVANLTLARAFSERLHALGCRFALDDFGAGFGSFSYLKHVPFDYLKIDGEFVRNIASDATDRLLVTAVVDIARGLGKETIAEFVGSDQTVAVLRELGIDWGQGYHLGEPAPLEAQLERLGAPAARP
jgi:EAL domain-containing protein (putative c-di-GMP-specific phosphodiesterase class I)